MPTKSGPSLKLFTFGNPKTLKGTKISYLPMVLMLSPWERSGVTNVCPHASPGCIRACLNTAGQGGFGVKITADPMKIENKVQAARRRRTEMFKFQRAEFFSLVIRDIEALIRFARGHKIVKLEFSRNGKVKTIYFSETKKSEHGMTPCVRLNGTSDLQWEAYSFIDNGRRFPNIMAMFPALKFYDYTKVPGRINRPRNYYLNYSWNDKVLRPRFKGDDVEYRVREYMRVGVNPVVVFDKLPATWMNRRVIDGTEHDVRFIDPPNVVVGLLPLKFAEKDKTGFVVRTGTREYELKNPPVHHDYSGLFPDEEEL